MGEDNISPEIVRKAVLSVDNFSSFLGTTYGKIKHYYYSRDKASHYTFFNIPKKSGGVRVIRAPNNQLKMLQVKILRLLEVLYSPRSSVKGFVKNGSISDNAQDHTRKKFVFNIDIKDFFHSVTFARVYGLLKSEPYCFSNGVASVIAHLSTVDGVLPQGAPTSPILSNMICSGLDRELSHLARKYRAQYTRYADDITFSFYCPIEFLPPGIVIVRQGQEGFSHCGALVGFLVLDVLNRHGFNINMTKVRLQGRYERQAVTGLVVNKKVNVPREFVRKTCALIHSMEVYGLEQACVKARVITDNPEFNIEPHVQGRVLFIKQVQGVDSPVYQRVAKSFNALLSEYKVPLVSKLSDNSRSKTLLGKAMRNKCWVIHVDDICSQGTGFMLESGLIATCAHVFVEDGERDWSKFSKICEVIRVSDKTTKIAANVVHFDKNRDIALLKIDTQDKSFDFLRLEDAVFAAVDHEVSIWGFPNYKVASPHVGRIWAEVTNDFKMSMVRHLEVDKTLYSGNSGGPVLNQAEQVVGIAAKGAVDGTQLNSFICVEELMKVISEYEASLAK